MNKNRYWNQNKGGRISRGGFNRGGRGSNRGWPRNRGGFGGPTFDQDGFGGGNRFTSQNDYHPNTKFWKTRQEKREKRETPGKRLSEDLIGVTEYISDHEGFNGIIKSRYSDFQVSEVNEKGEIAKLTTTEPPARPRDETVDDDEGLLLNKYNLELLPMETWDKINSLAVNSNTEEGEKVEIDMEGVSKEQRTRIHDAVKKAFGDSIVGSTVNVDDKKFMRFERYRKGVRIDNRVKWVWPGEYVYFIVHKENCDTMDAAVRIAERIGVHLRPSMIGYAGTKDRRAKTSQWFSVKRIDPARIANACKQLRDIHIGNFSFSNCHLKLGMLKGNKFRIALRNVTAPEESVDAACQHLREKGFINYYGLQRFGSRVDTPTYDIGLKLLQGNYKEAIAGILEAREGPLCAALSAYRARGPAAALPLLPRRALAAAHSEARLIRALAAAPNDLLGALNKLARNIRLLYLHSYQSLIWNRAVSERIRRYGLRPALGDCVPLTIAPLQDDSHMESDSEDEEDEEEGNATTEGDSNAEQKTKKEKKENKPKATIPVKILTQRDIDSGHYTMFNIVLPLPGASVEYPPNMIDFYEENLKKDGLTLDMKHKVKSFTMSGAYRHMVVRPLDVQWQHVRYDDPFADLLASDRDELHHNPVTGIVADGKYRALILSMILPSSCYATMALRELLKVDTSSDNQALLNNYHKRNKKTSASESGEEQKETSEGKVDANEEKDENESKINVEEKMDGEKGEVNDEMVDASKEKQDASDESKVSKLETTENGEKRKLEEETDENSKKLKTEQ